MGFGGPEYLQRPSCALLAAVTKQARARVGLSGSIKFGEISVSEGKIEDVIVLL
jgi:hypothetical protein